MNRPKLHKTIGNKHIYLATDIDPLLDELESLRDERQPFPTLEEFMEFGLDGKSLGETYSYFAQFKTRPIEVMPEVGERYEGRDKHTRHWIEGKLGFFTINGNLCSEIRPIQTPTRNEVIAKAKELGLTDSEIEVLKRK